MRAGKFHAAALGMIVAAVGGISLADAAVGSNASARDAARLEATRALGAIALPPGAVRAATDPSGGALAVVALRPLTPRLVERHAFSRVPGSPQAALTWMRRHLPAGARITGRGEQSRPQGPTVSVVQLSFGHVPPGVMSSSLVVAAAPRSGATAIRVDAEAVWRLARPAWARVPRGSGH